MMTCPHCRRQVLTLPELQVYLAEAIPNVERSTEDTRRRLLPRAFHPSEVDSFKIGALTGVIETARRSLDCHLGRCQEPGT